VKLNKKYWVVRFENGALLTEDKKWKESWLLTAVLWSPMKAAGLHGGLQMYWIYWGLIQRSGKNSSSERTLANYLMAEKFYWN